MLKTEVFCLCFCYHLVMNIILTSAGLKMPAIQKPILELLPKPPSELKLAHVITASQVASDTAFVTKDRKAMKELGFKVTDILLEDLTTDSAFSILNEFDIIYVQGGNGFYLLKQARLCGFERVVREFLKNEKKWYIGVSAGTYIACPTIEMHNWKSEKEQYGLDDLTGMNLVSFLVVVHYNREKNHELLKTCIPTASCPVRIITDDQALFVQNGEVRLIGEGHEILAASF